MINKYYAIWPHPCKNNKEHFKILLILSFYGCFGEIIVAYWIVKKILVVDDEIDILAVVKIILNNHNFEVETLSKWENIPHAIQSYSPDLILLDVSLGGADGREICKSLKTDPLFLHIPIIMISAHPQAREECLAYGADYFLEKPFDMYDILDLVANAVN